MADIKMYHIRMRGEAGATYNIPALGVTKKDGEYVFLLEENATFGIERLAVEEVALLMHLPPDALQSNEPVVPEGAAE